VWGVRGRFPGKHQKKDPTMNEYPVSGAPTVPTEIASTTLEDKTRSIYLTRIKEAYKRSEKAKEGWLRLGNQMLQAKWEAVEAKRKADIIAAYAGAYPDEAFEAFDSQGITVADIEATLGEEAANEYSHWIYCNLK
jgi:hypothetical protein